MIYIELQFDPDTTYLEHEKEFDNPQVIQALTRFKQNTAGDFAEAYYNRGERLYVCSQFVYELIQLGKNLEYRQVPFANLARGMNQREILNALQLIQNSCITLVDTALMAMEEVRQALSWPATILFLELQRTEMDRAAAVASAKEIYYIIAWKSCGSGITADVALYYGLTFDSEPTAVEHAVQNNAEVTWPFFANIEPGYEDISYAIPPTTILEGKYSRSKKHQFLKQVQVKVGELLGKRVRLQLREVNSNNINIEPLPLHEKETFSDVVKVLMSQADSLLWLIPLTDEMYPQVFGEQRHAPVYWKKGEGNESDANNFKQQLPLRFTELQDDDVFFKKLNFKPLEEKENLQGDLKRAELSADEIKEVIDKNPLWNIVHYVEELKQEPPVGWGNLYYSIQSYTLKAYDSTLYLLQPGPELSYNWKASGIITDAVIVPPKYTENEITQIARAIQPTFVIKRRLPFVLAS